MMEIPPKETVMSFLRIPSGDNSRVQVVDGTSVPEQRATRAPYWVSRDFELLNLIVTPAGGEPGKFLVSLELQRNGLTDSDGSSKPVRFGLLLRFKAEPKELGLLSGLLGRTIRVEEEFGASVRSKEQVLEDLLIAQEDISRLEHENRELKHLLMDFQRPRRT